MRKEKDEVLYIFLNKNFLLKKIIFILDYCIYLINLI